MKFKYQKIPACRQAGKIISNKKVKDNYFEIIIEAPEIAKYARPGQFVNLKVSDSYEPLLRRPLSVHRVSHKSQVSGHRSEEKEYIVMLYEVVGKGTEVLSKRKPGDYLDVIGPLGNGFVLEAGSTTPDARRILVAGGMGTAPLIFLAEKLAKLKTQDPKLKTLVLIGAKTKNNILCEKEFKKLGCEVKIATDDGSRGFKGYVSDLLKHLLWTMDYGLRTIYACGPAPMLKEISLISRKYRIPAQISLEAHLACGIGACMGCVIKTQNDNAEVKMKNEFEYKRVCKEGPVFEAVQVIWD